MKLILLIGFKRIITCVNSERFFSHAKASSAAYTLVFKTCPVLSFSYHTLNVLRFMLSEGSRKATFNPGTAYFSYFFIMNDKIQQNSFLERLSSSVTFIRFGITAGSR